jgi:hypothetical protein
MIEPVKTYYGYPRVTYGWNNTIQWTARVDTKYIYRCTKCGLYLWTLEQAKEHNAKTNHP